MYVVRALIRLFEIYSIYRFNGNPTVYRIQIKSSKQRLNKYSGLCYIKIYQLRCEKYGRR